MWFAKKCTHCADDWHHCRCTDGTDCTDLMASIWLCGLLKQLHVLSHQTDWQMAVGQLASFSLSFSAHCAFANSIILSVSGHGTHQMGAFHGADQSMRPSRPFIVFYRRVIASAFIWRASTCISASSYRNCVYAFSAMSVSPFLILAYQPLVCFPFASRGHLFFKGHLRASCLDVASRKEARMWASFACISRLVHFSVSPLTCLYTSSRRSCLPYSLVALSMA